MKYLQELSSDKCVVANILTETNDTDEDDEVSEEGEELDLDDEDEDEHEDEENEPDKTQLDNQTSALMDAPSLQVQLDEDMTPGGRVDENDEEENTEDEGSEDAKKVTKRAKKRVKEERSVPLFRFSGSSAQIHNFISFLPHLCNLHTF